MDKFLGKLTEIIDDKLGELTNGTIKLDSILQGQLKVDGSHYVDKALKQLSAKMCDLNLNDLKLPQFSTSFNKEFCCLNIPGTCNFTDAVLSGFTNIKRFDPTEILVDVTGEKLISAKTSIGIEQLSVACPTLLNVLFLDTDFLIKALLKEVQLNIGLGIGRDFNFSLDTFDVKSTGKLQLNPDDLAGLPEDIVDKIETSITKAIFDKVKEFFQKDVKTLLEEIVAKLEFLQ